MQGELNKTAGMKKESGLVWWWSGRGDDAAGGERELRERWREERDANAGAACIA